MLGLFDSSCLEISGGVFVGLVALWALDNTLPLRTAPLRMFRVECEGRVLICERRFTGLAYHEPALRHSEILSRSSSRPKEDSVRDDR
jgi:hypothetical protein